tara:strand:- start:362 stop:1276 length:915 start_codon:yes stop_codon:yes gene_type:complete
MGTSSYSVEVCKSIINSGFHVVGVCTKPDSKIGRGKDLTPHPLKDFALKNDVTVLTPIDLTSCDVLRDFSELKPNLIVLVGYGLLVPSQILKLPEYGCLNIHPSLLPRYRGPSPVSSAIINGDDFTGVSVMLMDEGLDTGPVLQQKRVIIDESETANELTYKLFKIGGDMLVDLIPLWTDGSINLTKQDETQASNTSKIVKQDGRIKWDEDAQSISRKVRAYSPWPGTFSTWRGKNFKLLDAKISDPVSKKRHGKLSGSVTEGLYVSTGKGILEIKSLQMEGKQPTSAKEFIIGYPDFEKDILT